MYVRSTIDEESAKHKKSPQTCPVRGDVVPLTGLEPVLRKPERDFKSRVSTYSTTAAYVSLRAEGWKKWAFNGPKI